MNVDQYVVDNPNTYVLSEKGNKCYNVCSNLNCDNMAFENSIAQHWDHSAWPFRQTARPYKKRHHFVIGLTKANISCTNGDLFMLAAGVDFYVSDNGKAKDKVTLYVR